MERHGKPILGVFLLEDEMSKTVTEIEDSPYKGLAFVTPERAIRTLARMADYYDWRKGEGIRQEGC